MRNCVWHVAGEGSTWCRAVTSSVGSPRRLQAAARPSLNDSSAIDGMKNNLGHNRLLDEEGCAALRHALENEPLLSGG